MDLSHLTDEERSLTDEELARRQRMMEIEDANSMRDAQRTMAWFALSGMLLYPFAVVLAVLGGLESAATILGNMAATYFVSVAGIVGAYFGAQAYSNKKTDKK
jgi:uncharacterized membrane protein